MNRSDLDERLDVLRKTGWSGLANEIDSLRKALAQAEDLAQRSTRRLVEASEPGWIGAFAARDAAISRAAAAEALLAEAQEVLEFYALLGSRKATALIAKIKQREISPS